MSFRDDHERKAHDIICIVRFGGIGGSVRQEDIRRVGDILRGQPLVTAPKLPSLVVTPKLPALVTAPTIPVLPRIP